jgi:phage anti-repressor protein
MSELDIVELIEKNPIVNLSNTYNNKLLSKIKNIFTETQQKLFISCFYCYLNYNKINDYVIDLDNVWQWLGFSQKIRAKELLEKYFKLNIDYKINLPAKKEKNGRGGSNKEKIMLNIKTFKLFCLKSATKKSHEIHEYFIKLEEILRETISEESNELKSQLEKIKESQEIHCKKFLLLEREKLLLREFSTDCSLVYIIKVKDFDNGNYIVKIGESRRGIQGRYAQHKTKYKNIILLDCFKISKSKDFENFLHHHPKIRPNRVNNLEGHEKEVELFLIGEELSYNMLLTIIHDNINSYKDVNEIIVEKLMNKIETTETLTLSTSSNIGINSDILQQLLDNQIQMSKQIQALEKTNKEILEKLTQTIKKPSTNFNQISRTVSHKLQKINPETMTIVKVYDSVAQCLIENNYKLKRPSIEKAITESRIYHGFLWGYVAQDKDPNIIHNPITIRESRPQNIGYIAKLNKEQTQIISLYIDRKTAALQNGYISSSALDNHVKNKTLTKEHYYILYDKCEKKLISEFIEKNGEPILYKDGVGQFNFEGDLVKEFVCKYDCIKQLKMSDKTLKKALDENVLYNNYYFKSLDPKLFI